MQRAVAPETEPLAPEQLVTPPVQPRLLSLRSLVLLAAITLGLCGLMFGLWNMRIVNDLSSQTGVLKEKRSELLDQIRERNREIASLSSLLDSMRTMLETAAPGKRNPVRTLAEPDLRLGPVGDLPLSFDNGSPQNKLVALTFDGGGGANAAREILDTLRSRNVKVTMFLTGEFMQRKQDVVRLILSEGHEIGSHTYSHPHLTSFAQDHTQTTLPSVTEAFLAHELAKTDSIFTSIYGVRLMPFWRSPYGEHNRTICVWGQRAGFLHIGWGQGRTWRKNLDSNDWTPNEETAGYHTPQEVYNKIIELAGEPPSGINGGIILMHLETVRSEKEKQVHLIIGKLIDSLVSLGYRIVTVSELLRESGVDISPLVKREVK